MAHSNDSTFLHSSMRNHIHTRNLLRLEKDLYSPSFCKYFVTSNLQNPDLNVMSDVQYEQPCGGAKPRRSRKAKKKLLNGTAFIKATASELLQSPLDPNPTGGTNSINFFTPSLRDSLDSFQLPCISDKKFPVPSASGIIRIDELSTKSSESNLNSPLSDSGIPRPSPEYLQITSIPPQRLSNPREILLILDLNGTLLYRRRHRNVHRNKDMRKSSKKPILRPYLKEFMAYTFENFKVMFWSSAKRHNVNSMIRACTTEEQRDKIVAIWGRDTLDLAPEEYNKRVPTVKDLQKILRNPSIRKAGESDWDLSNTLLLDDSVMKAVLQPYNHVCIPEFMGDEDYWMGKLGEDDTALREVIGYLEELRYQAHVARFIRQEPFRVGDG